MTVPQELEKCVCLLDWQFFSLAISIHFSSENNTFFPRTRKNVQQLSQKKKYPIQKQNLLKQQPSQKTTLLFEIQFK